MLNCAGSGLAVLCNNYIMILNIFDLIWNSPLTQTWKIAMKIYQLMELNVCTCKKDLDALFAHQKIYLP